MVMLVTVKMEYVSDHHSKPEKPGPVPRALMISSAMGGGGIMVGHRIERIYFIKIYRANEAR
jgi:hypothetical protein